MSSSNSPPPGVAFPETENGDRSSTTLNKAVMADSAAAFDKDLAKRVEAEPKWRFRYHKYSEEYVKGCLLKPENALKSARAGLESIQSRMTYIRDGDEIPLKDAMDRYTDQPYFARTIRGKGKAARRLEVPYKGKTLAGEELIAQLHAWADYGTIERDTAESIAEVVANDEWVDLSDRYFVLLGAGAAMGPLLVLTALGANVIALDINFPAVWSRLIAVARNGTGTVTFPVSAELPVDASDEEVAESAGCDVMRDMPLVANWLEQLYPKEHFTVGCYVYLNGEAHVRVALACDMIMERLCRKRQASIAFLCTPTDLHVIPADASAAARANYDAISIPNLFFKLVGAVWPGRCVRNVSTVQAADGEEICYVDGLVVDQGPNYALAKRMQHWRAIVARLDDHCVVSSNIAPSTATRSVMQNRNFAWAYDGLPAFKPFEVMQEGTSNAVMAALLIYDLNSKAAPSQPNFDAGNPLSFFAVNGFHGGVWRCAFKFGSIGELCVLIHFLKVGRPLFALLALYLLYAFFF